MDRWVGVAVKSRVSHTVIDANAGGPPTPALRARDGSRI